MNVFALSTLSLVLVSSSAFAVTSNYEIRLPSGTKTSAVDSVPAAPSPTIPSFTQAQAEAAWSAWMSSVGLSVSDWSGDSINKSNAVIANNPDLNATYASASYLPNEQWPSTTMSNVNFYNNNLTDASFLVGVTSTGDLNLASNNLTNVDGLDSLVTAGSYLFLYNNELTNIDGLMSLESVGMNLWMHNNNISNLNSLSNLTSIGRSLRIHDNPNLTDVSGLRNIAEFDPSSLYTDEGIYINIDQVFTAKAPLGSPLCNAILSGAAPIYLNEALQPVNTTTQALLCQ